MSTLLFAITITESFFRAFAFGAKDAYVAKKTGLFCSSKGLRPVRMALMSSRPVKNMCNYPGLLETCKKASNPVK
jgi:hypothetical protein